VADLVRDEESPIKVRAAIFVNNQPVSRDERSTSAVKVCRSGCCTFNIKIAAMGLRNRKLVRTSGIFALSYRSFVTLCRRPASELDCIHITLFIELPLG
jgi:hypothetical protein